LLVDIPEHLLVDNGPQPWTMKTTTENTHVVISQLSGLKHASNFYYETVAPLLNRLGLQEGVNYSVCHTKNEQSITHLTDDIFLANAAYNLPQHIILLSGDGGVSDILNCVMRDEPAEDVEYRAPVLNLLPMGTGNALANSTGILDRTLGLRSLVCGSPKPLPCFKASFTKGSRLLTNEGKSTAMIPNFQEQLDEFVMYGAIVCSWALHASIVADSDTSAYRVHGTQRFQMAAKELMFPPDQSAAHTYQGTLKLSIKGNADWKSNSSEEHSYLLVTMVSNLEEHFTISPASQPFDGSMRMVHIGRMDSMTLGGLFDGAYHGGKHVDDQAVEYEEIEKLSIAFKEDDERWRRVCVDGKIVRVEKDGGFTVSEEKREALMIRVYEHPTV
jgi:diacylglycerol kinase family enzyme